MKKPAPFRNYHVTEAGARQTLATALRGFLPEQSWGQVRKLISSRRVQVNGNLCVDESRKVQAGDVIKVWAEPLPKPVDEQDIRIRYIDAHLVVIEKPAGITTIRHPEERDWPAHRKQLQPTLDELLPRVLAAQAARKHRAAKSGGAKEKPEPRRLPRIRPVHRLDRDTSGLMVFARTVDAERGLVHQFRKHTIERRYLAIVHGDAREQTIETQLVRNRGDGRRGSTDYEDQGQRAVTHVTPVERLNGYTLVECRLETGRTHQIRIHLAENGHMVCGEKVYRHGPFRKPQSDRSGATRQALHAFKLGFVHPISGEPLSFEMPMPLDMQKLVVRLRARTEEE